MNAAPAVRIPSCAMVVPMLLVLAAAAPLHGQVCAGFAPLDETRYRVAVSAASYAYATAMRASVTVGGTPYASLGIGRTRDAELDAVSVDAGLEAGLDLTAQNGTFYLCPVAAFTASFGPDDFLFRPDDYTYTEGAAGFGLAVVPLRAGRVTVLAGADARLAHLTVRRVHRSTEVIRWKYTNTYTLWSVGAGVVLDDVLTFRTFVTMPSRFPPPSTLEGMAVPFGREEGEVSFGAAVGLNFGRRVRPPR